MTRYRPVTASDFRASRHWGRLSRDQQVAFDIVSRVLAFRTNEYVLDELIDWDRVPDDPVFQLTIPQRGMLSDGNFGALACLLGSGNPEGLIATEVARIRMGMNPHPAGQMTLNVPADEDGPIPGVQHKYPDVVLVFPPQGQTCHAYCNYCFRWAQFVGDESLRFAATDMGRVVRYLERHPEVTDVLLTGGDPMVLNARSLAKAIEPLLGPGLEHVRNIRIGTKALAYWPQRFTSDPDADGVARIFEGVVASGRRLSVMAHFSHAVELSTEAAARAVDRVASTGATIYLQAPIVRHVNADARAWRELITRAASLGIVPYYMFVERNTGACRYFEIPLREAWEIYRDAAARLSGLSRTLRGPVMSCTPGKVLVLGIVEAGGRPAFALEYIRSRDPGLAYRPFLAAFSERATWFDQLEPFGPEHARFFAEP